MKKLISIFTVLLIATPAMAVPNTNVATTSYVQGAYDALDAAKQDTIDSTHKLSADLVDDSTSTNKFVTASDKTTWNGKQDLIDSTHKLSADLVEDGTTNKVVTATEKSTWNGKQDALTTAQQNAVDSGITSAKVTTYDGYATTKQDTIDSTHKLSADLVEDGTTNKVVTATEKSTWNGKQDAITVSGGATSTDGQYVNGVALSNGTMTVSKSYLTVPVKSGGNYAATGAAIWFE